MKTTDKPAFELRLERVVDAPRERVYKAWADPKEIVSWFAPKPYTLIVHKMDFKPGGRFEMAMRAPDGAEHSFGGVYREINPPSRLAWTGEFTNGPKDQIRTEVDFVEQGGKTTVRARQTFSVLTPETEPATQGAQQGWTMTLNQLAAHCSSY